MDLHPAELGRLTLRVGIENDSVTATIVTSELATNELLTRDKQILIDTLREQGMEVDSFEVSYGGSETQNQSRNSDPKNERRFVSAGPVATPISSEFAGAKPDNPSGINLIA